MKKRLMWSLLMLLIGMRSFGQTVNLEEYLNLLKEENLLLKQSEYQLHASTLDVSVAKAGLRPSISLESNYQRDFTKNFLFVNDPDFGNSRFRTNFNNYMNVDLLASQSIYDPQASAQIKLAKLAQHHTVLTHEDATHNMLIEGAKLFWQTIYARESLEILVENNDLAQGQWNQVQELFEHGMVSELEVRQSELFYKRALSDLASAENAFETLKNRLKYLVNLKPSDPLELSGSIELTKPIEEGFSTGEVDQSVKIKSAKQAVDMATQAIRMSQAAKLPVLRLNLGYNFNAQDDQFNFTNNNKLWFGQVTLQIPLYTGGFNSNKIAQAKINENLAKLQLEDARQQLTVSLQNARLRYELALEKVSRESEAIALSEKEIEIAIERTKLGTLTPLENKEIRLNLIEAKLNLLNAYLDLRNAQLEIKRIIGTSE